MNKITLLLAATLFLVNTTAQNSAFDAAKKHFSKQGDTLKIKALDFLEDNISGHYSRIYT